MNRGFLIASVLLLLLISTFGLASAHAGVDHCTPAPGSTLLAPPAQVVCVLTEELDTKLSTIAVFDSQNQQVDKRDGHVDLNDPAHKTLLVSVDPAALGDGTYTVKWHAVTTDDNGVTDGSYRFTVTSPLATPFAPISGPPTSPGAPTTLPTTGATDRPTWGLLVLLGGFLFAAALLLRAQYR